MTHIRYIGVPFEKKLLKMGFRFIFRKINYTIKLSLEQAQNFFYFYFHFEPESFKLEVNKV